MSYGTSLGLQRAVYQRLLDDAAVQAAVGDAIYDAVPPGQPPALYVSLGPETVRDGSDKTGRGSQNEFIVSVLSEAAGFADAKAVAGAVCDALVDADLALGRGRLVSLYFLRARAARQGKGGQRRIDMTFRAFVEDN